MAIHFFNVCIDMPDPEPDYIPEDLSLNDQESIIEFLAEKVFGIEDAFAEHDEADTDSEFQINKDLKVYSKRSVLLQFERSYVEVPLFFRDDFNNCVSFIKEVIPPPPKA